MTDADTLRLLDDAAAGLARFDAARVRSWRNRPPLFDREIWQDMAAQGWFSILVAEDEGGLELGLDAACVVAKACGAAAMPEPFCAAGVVAPLVLARCPPGAQRNAALASVVAGNTVASLAWQNAAGRLEVSQVGVKVEHMRSGVRLDGETRFVPVPHADAFIVAATAADGIGLYWLDARTAGLRISPEPHADGNASGRLDLGGVELPAADCLAQGDTATAILAEAIDVGTVVNCAELNGLIDHALQLTLEYLKTRQQFGQPIGAFQVLQHRAVDLWMHKEVAGHATNAAVRTLQSADLDAAARALAASSAKARVGNVARLIANETVQLHGAIGFTDEYDLGLYVNRLLALVPYFGNAAEHRARYGSIRQSMRLSR